MNGDEENETQAQPGVQGPCGSCLLTGRPEAAKEEKTISEIAQLYEVHPNQIRQWKRELLEHAAEVFAGKRVEAACDEKQTERLHQKIGQLTVEVDWLKKKCKLLQIPIDDWKK